MTTKTQLTKIRIRLQQLALSLELVEAETVGSLVSIPQPLAIEAYNIHRDIDMLIGAPWTKKNNLTP